MTIAQSSSAPQQQIVMEQLPKTPVIGLSITSVDNGSPAMSVGLQKSDIVIKYGDTQVLDNASFFSAQEAYTKRSAPNVDIVIVRAGKQIRMVVPPGRLGFYADECNPALFQIYSLMQQSMGMAKVPPDQLELAMREGSLKETPQTLILKAAEFLNRAEQEKTLTKEQILAARIYMIPDEATQKEEIKRQDLLKQLLSNQSGRYILWLGQEKFFHDKKYRAAIECFNQHLNNDPSDVSIRLNLGVAYADLMMFDEAEAAANYVLDNKLSTQQN